MPNTKNPAVDAAPEEANVRMIANFGFQNHKFEGEVEKDAEFATTETRARFLEGGNPHKTKYAKRVTTE